MAAQPYAEADMTSLQNLFPHQASSDYRGGRIPLSAFVLLSVVMLGVVLWRYRKLVPLMYLLLIVEVCLRMVAGTLHPLTEDFYLRTPPGQIGNLLLLALCAVMLFLSLKNRDADASAESIAPA